MAIFIKANGNSIQGTSEDYIILVTASDDLNIGLIDGGSGTDEIRFDPSSSETLTLGANVTGVESVTVGRGVEPVADTTGVLAAGVDASFYSGPLTLTGNSGSNMLIGTSFADVLAGGAGADILDGNSGIDTLIGGVGDDTYVVDDPADQIIESPYLSSIVRAATNAAGGQVSGFSVNATPSSDGRYVAFISASNSLVPGDTNNFNDVFVKDLQSGAIVRANTDAAGGQANNSSASASFSADGRYVVFDSVATNLVAGDTNSSRDVFVKDLQTGTIVRASTTATGGQANGSGFGGSLSADGRYVVFESSAANLVAGDTNISTDVFVKDLQTGAIVRANTDAAGGQTSNVNNAFNAALSADGRYVVFESLATNLVVGDTNGQADIFVKDLQTGAIVRANTSAAGAQANNQSAHASISSDGRYVAFDSFSTNLVAGDTNGSRDIYVKDLQTGEVVRASATAAGGQADTSSFSPSFSADGRYVVFESSATNLVAGDTNGQPDVFVKDLQSGSIVRANTSAAGVQTNTTSLNAALSADGRYVVFESGAANLVAGDTNVQQDIFVKDLLTGTIVRASTTTTGAQANSNSFNGSISADGRYVVFESGANNLVAGDTSGRDIFVKDLQTGTIARVNTTAAGGQTVNLGASFNATISADGSHVIFESDATTLATGDTNSTTDIFVKANPLHSGSGVDSVQSSIGYLLGADIENLTLTGTNPIDGTGNELANTLTGNAAANVLDGGAGADTISGGGGDDTYVIDNPLDVVIENTGEGFDTVRTRVDYTLAANVEAGVILSAAGLTLAGTELDNVLTDGAGADSLLGLGGNDTLIGNDGADLLDGGAGIDTMSGGGGDDTYVLDDALDLTVENFGNGVDTVRSSVSHALAPNIEILVLTGTLAIDGTGNELANTLTGNAAANVLDGGAGADTISGGGGDDTYVIDNPLDVVIENTGEGFDTVRTRVDYTLAANVEAGVILARPASRLPAPSWTTCSPMVPAPTRCSGWAATTR